MGAVLLCARSTASAGGDAVSFGAPQFAGSDITTPIGVGIGDLNLDGRLDAAGLYFGLVVFYNQQGVLVPDDANPLPYIAPFEPMVRIADVSGDGLADIIALATGGQNLTLFLQQPDGTFVEVDTGIVTATYVPRFALGRFNDDDLPDVAMSSLFGVHLNVGSGQFEPVTEPVFVQFQTQVFAANLDGDGLDDLVTVISEPETARVYRNLGGGAMSLTAEYPLPFGVGVAELVTMSDFNHDGLSDLAAASWQPDGNAVFIRLAQPDATFAEAAPYPFPGVPKAIAAGDLNGDGHEDLAVGLATTASVVVLLGTGDGTFAFGGQLAPPVQSTSDVQVMDLLIADVTGDWQSDLVMALVGYGLVVIPNTTPVIPGDINGDGDVNLDDPATLVQVLLGSEIAPAFVARADLNGDGRADGLDIMPLVGILLGS